MADTSFLPLVRSGNVNAVSVGSKPPVKGGKRRGHAALRRSVSSLAIICALGAAALPGTAAAQAVNGTAGMPGMPGFGPAASGLGGAGAIPGVNSGGNGGYFSNG